MATIKQLTKRIEVITRDIEKSAKRITMYTDRTGKAIAKLNATGFNITTADIMDEVTQYGGYKHHNYKLNVPGADWSLVCNVLHNWEYMKEAERDMEHATRELANVNQELAKLTATEIAANELHAGTLATALRYATEQFRGAWFARMEEWHRKHYAYIKARVTGCRRRNQQMARVRDYYKWHAPRERRAAHARLVEILEVRMKNNAEVIMDKANQFDNLAGYMSYVDECLKKAWEACLVKLTDKCAKFNLNESAIKTGQPYVTEKGFEIVITDGTDRRIYARIIWAAEYSDVVAPHTRYIITEKKTK